MLTLDAALHIPGSVLLNTRTNRYFALDGVGAIFRVLTRRTLP